MLQEKIIYGIHAIKAILEHHPENILVIFCQKETDNPRLRNLLEEMQAEGFSLQYVSPAKLEKLADSRHHQGIVASVRVSQLFDEKALLAWVKQTEKNICLLVLEGIQDPHNVGACLRSAEALGVDAVILSKDNTAPLNATVSKAACGAEQTLKIVSVSNVVRCLTALQAEGVWIIGTSGSASKAISAIKIPKRVAIVMGSEGKGLKRLTLETCDEIVKIPLVGQVSSLNVSVATGIFIYACQTQHRN